MKKTGLFLLAVIVLMGCLSVSCSFAEDTSMVCDGYTYTVLPDGTACVTGWTGDDTELILPDSLDGVPVSTIGFLRLAVKPI